MNAFQRVLSIRSCAAIARPHPLTALCAWFVLGVSSSAQAPDAARGHRLYSPRPNGLTHLVDRTGEIVHTWNSNFAVANAVYMLDDGTLLRTIKTNPGTPLATLPGNGGGVQRLAFDSTVLWEYRYETATKLSHHDIEPLPNGNVLMIAWETKTPEEARLAGRDPALIIGDSYPDHIIEVQPTGPTSGAIVWEWHVWDHLIQDFDPSRANFGVVADHPERIDVNYPPSVPGGELNHMNGIDYDPVRDLIILSPRTQDEIWIIDHSTTTAEAAGSTGGTHGKGGDLLWRWGNPAAYDAGSSADQQLFGQHSPRFIPPGYPGAGNVTVFNNDPPSGQSEVNELELPLDANGHFVLQPGSAFGPAAPLWTYTDPAFYSRLMSSAERLPNGNTLICSSLQGRLFEVDPVGTIVWEHNVPPGVSSATFHITYAERTLWQSHDVVSAAAGATVRFDLVAGAEFDAQSMLFLGSFTGTSPGFHYQGFHFPLTPDPYLNYMLAVPNGPPHEGNFGLTDALGRRQTILDLPPGFALGAVGTSLHHAVVVFRRVKNRVTWVTNAVTLDIVP